MLTKVAFLGLSVLLGSEGYAAANIAKIPIGMRQLYEDGTATELACTAMTEELSECVFRVIGKGEEKSFSIVGNERRESQVPDYSYWSASRTDFTVAVDIKCPTKELGKLQVEDRGEAECRLFLMASDGKLVQRNVELWVAGVLWRESSR